MSKKDLLSHATDAIPAYVAEYEFRGDGVGGSCHTPTDDESELITDAISGFLSVLEELARRSPEEEAPDFWAVTSISGMHIGLWSDEATARSVLPSYRGATVTPLFTRAGGREAGLEATVAVDRSLLEAACAEIRAWKVDKGGDDQVVLNLEAALLPQHQKAGS